VGELEDSINRVLGNPAQMEKITSLARSLMGGAEEEKADVPELDPKMLERISAVMGGGGMGGKDERLLEALKPYLSEKRRDKMDRAVKIAKMARLAQTAALFGGKDDV